ncbi:MAG: hypothetical protein ACYDEJ_06905 [Desulfitobacteriaceae bacterium]
MKIKRFRQRTFDKNISFAGDRIWQINSIGGVNSRLVLEVAVSMSDGSGYLIQLDGYTREFVSFETRPDGV